MTAIKLSTQQLISRIGETDQQFLQENTPELALLRAQYRLQLVNHSRLRQEKLYFLQEAIVLLEQARVGFDEMPMPLYLALSLELARAYMQYFELTGEQRFALIVQQILKPLAHWKHGGIYHQLALASAIRNEPALTRHWLGKYRRSAEYDAQQLNHDAFAPYVDRTSSPEPLQHPTIQ